MTIALRNGFYAGLVLALTLSLFLLWLWQPERQINRHTEHLFQKLERKNWAAVADFIAPDYKDQWGDDRSLVLARAQAVFSYAGNIKFDAAGAQVIAKGTDGTWSSKIILHGGNRDEMGAALKERINSLSAPFELDWRRVSWSPWDWKLVSVANPELQIGSGFE